MSLSDWSKRAGALIASDLGCPAAAVVFAVQAKHEDADGASYGAQTNNPLNLRPSPTGMWEGQTGVSSGGFSEFDTLEHGCAACALNYHNGSAYQGVRDALAAQPFDPLALAQAIQDSPWDADHYGGNLVSEVAAELGGDVAYPTLFAQSSDLKLAVGEVGVLTAEFIYGDGQNPRAVQRKVYAPHAPGRYVERIRPLADPDADPTEILDAPSALFVVDVHA